MKGLVLLLLAGVSLAAFPGDISRLENSADPRLKGYKPRNTYSYQYEACLTSGFPETEQQYAGLKITCDTEFFIESDSLAYLKIKNPKLYEVNGTTHDCSSDAIRISPVSEELALLLKQPIKFEYKDGKVGQIYCNKDEPEYILNIKRGILSVLHHNFTKPEIDDGEPRLYKNWENGSFGLCENIYDVQYIQPESTKIPKMKISKTLNLNNCTRTRHIFSNVPGIRCVNKNCSRVDEPLKTSILTSCDLLGKESNFVVKMCETKSRYIFAPTQMKGSAATIVKQVLRFKEVKAQLESYEIVSNTPHTLEMTGFDKEDAHLTNQQRQEIVTKTIKLIELLIKSVHQKDWKGYKFTALVEMLRKGDRDTLTDIWDRCADVDQLRLWLLEALPFVYKKEVFELVADKICSRELRVHEAIPVLRGLALTKDPSERMCMDISDLCLHSTVQEDETLLGTCYLTQGALMYHYCKDKDVGCFSDKALELKNRLLTASYREKIFLVKSIGNFGHKSLYLPLLDIIQDTENTLELRVTAVYALRRIAAKVPQKVLPVLLKIFRDVHTDAELRMACFVVICDAKPGPAVFNLIVKQLNSERINQVRSFVVSSIKGMAFSRYPCDEKIAKLARIALKMIRRKTISFVPSKWLQWGEFSELVQLGGRADLQTIFTPSSFLPRAVTSKVKVHVLGRSVNLFETGVRGEGIQELLKPVVRPKEERRQEEPERRHGETADKKKLLNKLTRRNPYNKEVREMSKLLPIAEYEEEKAKGSFYFKVLGQELMYKYFTYDDVRELIEDGVISMNNDLKDILKKGKKFNLTKAFVPIEVKLVQPSVVGIPLKFVLQSVLFLRINTTVKAEMKPKFFIPLPEQVTVNGKINISVLHSTWGKMKICLPQLSTGSKMTLNININTSLGGSVQYDLKQSTYNTELDLPRDAKQIFSTEKQGYTFLMYNKPVEGVKDWNSLYRSTPLDGLEIGDMAQIGQTQRHPDYANWTLKTQTGKYLSINEQNELTLSDKPTIFKVVFIGRNRQFVQLFVPGKGYVKVKPNSKGCLETVEDERYPKLFKISYVKRNRFIRLATVVFIHPIKSNPTEWTETTAPRNTEEVLLFKHMIEDMTPRVGYREKWRYITDLPLDDIPREDRLHPRHMKIVFITPDEGKVCLRPNKSDESVFTVKRLHTTTEELCYGEKLLGMDVCLSGEYVEPLLPHPPVFPFCGPKKFNITIRPGKNPAHKIQFKLGKGDRYDADYKTWKAGVHLVGTNPEKKIETLVTYNVRDMQSDVTIEMHNMLPWLKRICIISHVFNWSEAEFFLKFGENCEQCAVKTHVTIKEPGRRQLSVVTSYDELPQPVMSILYKLFRALSKQYRDKLSNYWITGSDRNTVKFAVKLKTDQLVDLKLTMPTRVLTMDDVRIKTDGFIPRGNPLMHVVALSTPVCSLDYDTFKTFDDVEFQYSLPRRCVHVLAKDCVNNTFMVLASKEAENTDLKIIEIFVDKEKIRVEYLGKGRYQIQVNGVVIDLPKMFKLKSVATIVEVPEQEELHVLCENGLKVLIVRGIKVDIRVSPFFFNRTCGMCGDLNYEQYLDLKTPRGIPYTYPDKRKYGHLWMVPEDTCREVGCHFRKEYVRIKKDIEGNRYQCYPTTPVLRCLGQCQETESKFTRFPMTCVKAGSKEAQKITRDIEERTIDLAGSEVYFYKDLPEHMGCVCKCGQ